MSTASDTPQMVDSNGTRAIAAGNTRPFFWSVKREIWEHRSVWIAPLAAAGVVLFGFALRTFHLPHLLRQAQTLEPGMRDAAMAAPFAFAAGAILLTSTIVAFFYCLGALNNERRDRSILFWKSLPVSDATTVMSKAFIPFVVLPLTAFAVALVTQLIMLLLGSAILLASGIQPATLWQHWPLPHMIVVMLYVVVINVLWSAPIYGWLLMVSSWARRMPFLWAVLPWLGLAVFEKIATDTSYVWSFLAYRFKGAMIEGFAPTADHHHHKFMSISDVTSALAPGHFLSTPGLWLGLLAGAIFIAAAIYIRRTREPG
ncbi:MAG: ABC transporter permease [Alphaproteobacteria bacterium]|nr:ABC transporter permease [Alphaproteobacteria bacterium]